MSSQVGNDFEQIGKLPNGWGLAGLTKYIESLVDYRGATPEKVDSGRFLVTASNIRDGRIDYEASQEFVREEDYVEIMRRGLPRVGDLLLTTEAPLGQVASVDREDIALAQRVIKLRPKEDALDSEFLRFWMLSAPFQHQLQTWATGSTAVGIKAEKLHKLRVVLPPLDEQRAIAVMLNRETARLESLIAGKERLLKLLAEKRHALITQSVLRGLDPNSPLHDSGIPWLGESPSNWKLERTRWLFQERDERSQSGDEELLTVSHLTGVTPRSEKDVNMFEAATTEGYKICLAGDLVINTLWAWMGAMGVTLVDGIVSPAYNVYTPCPGLLPAYVDSLVRIPLFAEEATRYSKGVWSSRLRLYPEGFFEIWFPVPPIEDQHKIIAYITRETAKLDALRATTERTTALLKERRTSLITAAITGQLSVA